MFRRLNRAAAGLIVLAVALTGCAPDPDQQAAATIADGRAKAQLQAFFDARRQCAQVLTGTVPLGFHGPQAEALPGERIFFDLGFLQPAPRPADPELQSFAYFAEPTPQARSWFEIDTDEYRPVLKLCYGRRQVTNVWLEGRPGLPTLRYAYRLVDRAPWTLRPDVRRLYPFLDLAFARTFEPQDLIVLENGRWEPSVFNPNVQLDGGVATVFGYCPPDGFEKPAGCEDF